MRSRAVGARQDRGEENQKEWASEWPIQEAKDRERIGKGKEAGKKEATRGEAERILRYRN
jgi:hypothetical protein